MGKRKSVKKTEDNHYSGHDSGSMEGKRTPFTKLEESIRQQLRGLSATNQLDFMDFSEYENMSVAENT